MEPLTFCPFIIAPHSQGGVGSDTDWEGGRLGGREREALADGHFEQIGNVRARGDPSHPH